MATKKNNGEKRKVDKQKLIQRIVAWLLIIMTVVTTLYTTIYFLVMQVSASEPEEVSVAVGLLYGNSCDVAFTTNTTVGFTIGSETMGKYVKSFEPLWTANTPKVTVLGDRNFGKKSTGSFYHSEEDVAAGAYHIELDCFFLDRSEMESAVEFVDSALSFYGLSEYVIPSYINGEYRIRIGNYATEAQANDALSVIVTVLPDYSMGIVGPSPTGVSVVEHSTAKILFEYDCGTDTYLALEPLDNTDGTEAYLATYAGNLYDGVFVYKRYIKGEKDGIELIGVTSLEDYVMGVVPYEVSNSWPKETLKAFSIIARTYVITNMNKYWPTNGFNVCATANSQVYKGVARVNENVISAVTETAGQVVTYNGALAPVYYSSSVGNCTADVKYVWNGTGYDWLGSVLTPWEDYRAHSNAFWTVEATPEELWHYLNDRGYTAINSPVADISVDALAGENSSYVYQMTVTDENGNSVTVKRASNVRSSLLKYLNSANFRVGRGSVEYETYTKLLPPTDSVRYETRFSYTPSMDTMTTAGLFSVFTDMGKYLASFEGGKTVLTASSMSDHIPGDYVTVLTAESKKETVVVGSTSDGEYNLSDFIITETATANDPNNFIFVGKGWGHGVGLSQWGLYDLAGMGYDYRNMLTAYCPATSLADYKSVVSY